MMQAVSQCDRFVLQALLEWHRVLFLTISENRGYYNILMINCLQYLYMVGNGFAIIY